MQSFELSHRDPTLSLVEDIETASNLVCEKRLLHTNTHHPSPPAATGKKQVGKKGSRS